MPKRPKSADFEKPGKKQRGIESAIIPTFDPKEPKGGGLSKAAKVLRKHESELLAIRGVQGVSIQTGETGDDVLIVFVSDAKTAKRVPQEVEGIKIETEIEEFYAF